MEIRILNMNQPSFPKASYDFRQFVAVVTGGSQGIGLAIAQHLARMGAQLVIWDLQEGECGDNYAVDVTQRDQVEAATQACLKRYGRIDICINNAGFAGPTEPLDSYDPVTWQRLIDVNLLGVFNVCAAVVPVMKRNTHGRIVNISSLAGKEGTPNASAYSAAKAGVIALTKSLGKELAQTGILVNAIAPAAVQTSILEQMSPEHVQVMINKSPMQRLGEVQEVAELVAWLCSGSCTFSTGAVFDLSGGRATY
jgi:2-dehydro-3-deoxy-L-rhamnonate dehydrogenase (NAD+)